MSLQRLTLVLNASFEAINVVSGRRAIEMVMGGKAIVEKPSEHFIRSARLSIPVPSVIRLLVYRRVPRGNRSVSRKTILLRDRFTCQYCMRPFISKMLTLDHVVPRSRGGANSWENLVAACTPCNNRKSARTPAEAGMTLAHKPAPIGIHAKHRLLAGAETGSDWDEYLFV